MICNLFKTKFYIFVYHNLQVVWLDLKAQKALVTHGMDYQSLPVCIRLLEKKDCSNSKNQIINNIVNSILNYESVTTFYLRLAINWIQGSIQVQHIPATYISKSKKVDRNISIDFEGSNVI